ncbi:AMP-binding protein [Capnocytophaga sp. G2]|uniref:AMP-binding protein n=1 Tax=Capnocytophaga sp. G2 TaxID=3110695 RepID=UPI002B469E13|nr:AMP-binding protein [Capnocytophaga sp. G2]MEB3004407.1 AMP-binding protein [Capnocytophaga sp. G2]
MNSFIINHLHKATKINDIPCKEQGIREIITLFSESKEVHLQKAAIFLTQWFDEYDHIELQTSGTTGIPKKIQVKKKYMVHSAMLTGDFLCLKAGDTALCVLPTDYIAGKMMIVRALVLGLSLHIMPPSSTPFASAVGSYDFVALTPMQAIKSLSELYRARKIILGGAPISLEMEKAFQEVPSKIYATYGMTETVSHIALRTISPRKEHSSFYTTLGKITVSQDKNHCLVIDCPEVSDKQIRTHDVVILHGNKSFQWKGRLDNIINSGGIKIFPEGVESKLSSFISDRFFIWKEPDELLGEKVVLFVEGKEEDYPNLLSNLQKELIFSKYELPKKIYFLPQFKLTSSDKIQREATAKLVL